MSERNRRIVIGIVVLCILAAFLEAGFFILLHAGYDHHTGETCPVCARIKDACDVLRRLPGGLPKLHAPVRRALPPLFVSAFLLKFFDGIRCQTLITKKVRLND